MTVGVTVRVTERVAVRVKVPVEGEGYRRMRGSMGVRQSGC